MNAPISIYPGEAATLSEINRLMATLEEVAKKLGKSWCGASGISNIQIWDQLG